MSNYAKSYLCQKCVTLNFTWDVGNWYVLASLCPVLVGALSFPFYFAVNYKTQVATKRHKRFDLLAEIRKPTKWQMVHCTFNRRNYG